MIKIGVGDKWQVLESTSKFSGSTMTVTKILKDGSRRKREDTIYFKTNIHVDGETEHEARAWWFIDYCIKFE